MGDSFTLTLSGTSSLLEAQYFPPIELSSEKNYVLGLVELLTFNSIPNIDDGCNKFYINHIDTVEGGLHKQQRDSPFLAIEEKTITIPTGSYEIEDIECYLKKALQPDDITISLKANNNELSSELMCNHVVNFRPKDSIGRLLGFKPKLYKPDVVNKSELPVSILKVNAIRVECNITTGAYINGDLVHTVHEFFPSIPPGYKIIEVPANVIYLPVAVQSIRDIQLRIVDQDGELINFRGETITVRLHVRSIR